MSRFLFGVRGVLVEGPPPAARWSATVNRPLRCKAPHCLGPECVHPTGCGCACASCVDVRDAYEASVPLWPAVLEAASGDPKATEAELGGTFYGVSRRGEDGSFDYTEHHYMQRCRCRVIGNLIVRWCDAHDAYYACVLSGDQDKGREMAKRWAGVVERTDDKR
jgi:hypothetical protein